MTDWKVPGAALAVVQDGEVPVVIARVQKAIPDLFDQLSCMSISEGCCPRGGSMMIGRQLELPARPADIPFIMATERIPGFEKLVGRWSEEDHLAALRAPDYAYFLGVKTAGERLAFAIIRGIDDAHGNVCLKRYCSRGPLFDADTFERDCPARSYRLLDNREDRGFAMPLSSAAKQQRYRECHLGVDGLTRSQAPHRRQLIPG